MNWFSEKTKSFHQTLLCRKRYFLWKNISNLVIRHCMSLKPQSALSYKKGKKIDFMLGGNSTKGRVVILLSFENKEQGGVMWCDWSVIETLCELNIPQYLSEGRSSTEGERCQSWRSDSLPGCGHTESHHQPLHCQSDHHGGEQSGQKWRETKC